MSRVFTKPLQHSLGSHSQICTVQNSPTVYIFSAPTYNSAKTYTCCLHRSHPKSGQHQRCHVYAQNPYTIHQEAIHKSTHSTIPLQSTYFLHQHTTLPSYSNSPLTPLLQSVKLCMRVTKAHTHHTLNIENHVKYITLIVGSIQSTCTMQGSQTDMYPLISNKYHLEPTITCKK